MFKFEAFYRQSWNFPSRTLKSYLIAAVFVAAATLLRTAIGPMIVGAQFVTLFPAVFAATLLFGAEVGFFSAALATLCAWYFLLRPAFSFAVDAEQVPALAIFTFFNTLGVIFVGAMRAAIQRGRSLNETLTTAFEANPDAILLTNRHGRIVNVNRQAVAIFGKSHDAMIGAQIETLLPERFRARHASRRGAFMTSPHLRGMGVGLELRGQRHDGSEFPVDVQIGPIDVGGETMAIATVRDLTDQRALTNALAESLRRQATLEERARAEEELRLWADAFKCAAIGIEISDPATGTMRFVNPAYAATRGMSVEEAQGRRIVDAYAPAERPRLAALFAAADRDGSVTFESVQLRKDGSSFPTQKDIVSLRDSSGVVIYRVASSRDISESKRTEEALRHTQKMEAIGRLAAGVAHDFNNLLQSIMSGLELVLDDVPAETQAHEFAVLAFKSAQRGASLTRHLLAYARKQVLMPQSIDLSSFLLELRALMVRSLGPHIVVELRVGLETPPVFADQGQLQTALLNLAINAAHAMPKGGTLVVSASARSDGDDVDWVALAVTDTGTGMDEATLANATDPFFTTKGLDGSGLGLSMVKGFAEQSHGSLHISSKSGSGTTVELRLPVSNAAAEAPAAAGAALPMVNGRILLVDDAPDVLITTGAFLAKAGFKVVRAHDGNEALAIMAQGARFDAMATDYAMPGMNGVDLIIECRQIQPNLPALIITGFAEVTGQSALPDNVPVLHKPLTRLELIQTLLRIASVAADAE